MEYQKWVIFRDIGLRKGPGHDTSTGGAPSLKESEVQYVLGPQIMILAVGPLQNQQSRSFSSLK